MGKKSNLIFTVLFVIFIVAAVYVVSQNASQQVNDVLTIVTALVGFSAILYQMNMDHKIKRAEFIYQLNESFSSDDYIKETYDLLKQKRDLKKKNIEYEKLTEDECRTMGSYIMFFIIMNYLVNKGLLKLSMVDKIFANKFFLLCNNKQVQDYQLRSEDINYPVIELYEKWYNYRYLNNMEILYPDNSFSKETEIFNEKNGFISYKNKRKFSLKKLLRKLRLLIKKKK